MTSQAETLRLGLVGLDSSHAEDFLRHFNSESHFHDMRVTALWGPAVPSERVAELTKLSSEVTAAASLEALVESVDAVIVCDRNGARHREHTLPALAAGRPVFVDKPLANSLADAEAMVEAAERAGVALASGSALRWQAETAILKCRIAYLKRPLTVGAYGTWYPQSEHGGPIFYAIHTVELMQELIGTHWSGVRLDVGQDPVVRFEADGVEASLAFRPLDESGSSAFGVEIRSAEVRLERPIILPDDYMLPVCQRIATMLRSGHGMTRDELLAPLRMMAEIEALLAAKA